MKIYSKMRYYNNEILAIFKDSREIEEQFWGANFFYPSLSLLFSSFYGGAHPLQTVKVF